MTPDLAAALAALERQFAAATPQEVPALIGELERLRAVLWTKMVTHNGQPELPRAEDRLLTIPEVADRLGVPKGYVYELARRGEIPTVRFGKYVRVSVSAFQEWVARHQARALDTRRPLSHSRQAKAQARTGPATAKS